MSQQPDSNGADCPQCGHQAHRWPTLDSSGYLLSCDACGHEQIVSANAQSESAKPPKEETPSQEITTGRLRQLMAQTDPEEWPPELLEDLPEEARQRLGSKPAKNQSSIPSDMEKRLRGYGYVLAEDGSGTRLSGQGPKPGTGDLTPLDVVRLAAELEGGVPTEGEKQICPSCQAVLPPKSAHCQWCGQSLPADPSESG